MNSRTISERLLEALERAEAARSDDHECIRVWRFHRAPQELQDLSRHGGDEDWVAFVPAVVWEREGGWVPWAQSGDAFGCCDVSEHELPDGSVVLIGAHA